jgi:hypothetical protein
MNFCIDDNVRHKPTGGIYLIVEITEMPEFKVSNFVVPKNTLYKCVNQFETKIISNGNYHEWQNLGNKSKNFNLIYSILNA